MKKLFVIFIICTVYSSTSLSQNFGQSNIKWKMIPTSLTGKIDFVQKKDNTIYYAVGGIIKKIINNIESTVFSFPINQKIIQIYPSVNQSVVIVTQNSVIKVQNNGYAEFIYTVPTDMAVYTIHQSFIKNGRIVLLVVGYRIIPYSVKSHLLAINNEGGIDSLYTSVGNFFGTEIRIIGDSVEIEGSGVSPCSYGSNRIERLIWSEGRYQLISVEENWNKRLEYIGNSNLFLTSQPFQTWSCSWTGIEKYIERNGESYNYYSHHDSLYFIINGHGSWIPAATTGVDFNPFGGIKIGDNILFYGPIAFDSNGNYTSVRMYSLIQHNFQNIGRGLDSITSAWYQNINERKCEVILGSRGKIYIKHNLSVEPQSEVPLLQANYPNPFNPTTNIQYSLPVSGRVIIKVFDITGKEIITLLNEIKSSGRYTVKFDGSNLSSGVYFYKITAGDFIETKKMILMK